MGKNNELNELNELREDEFVSVRLSSLLFLSVFLTRRIDILQHLYFHRGRRRDSRHERGRVLISGSLRQASRAGGGFAAPLCKNNSDLQAPPGLYEGGHGMCGWGAGLFVVLSILVTEKGAKI